MQLHLVRHLRHVFVAATGEVHNDERVLRHFRRAHHHFGDGVRAFERWDDAFEPREFHERFERLVVGGVVLQFLLDLRVVRLNDSAIPPSRIIIANSQFLI